MKLLRFTPGPEASARRLAAAADQNYLEYGVYPVAPTGLVGATNHGKVVHPTTTEPCPADLSQGVTITVDGFSGVPTVTYSP